MQTCPPTLSGPASTPTPPHPQCLRAMGETIAGGGGGRRKKDGEGLREPGRHGEGRGGLSREQLERTQNPSQALPRKRWKQLRRGSSGRPVGRRSERQVGKEAAAPFSAPQPRNGRTHMLQGFSPSSKHLPSPSPRSQPEPFPPPPPKAGCSDSQFTWPLRKRGNNKGWFPSRGGRDSWGPAVSVQTQSRWLMYTQTSPSSLRGLAAEVSTGGAGLQGLTHWTAPLLFIGSSDSERCSLRTLPHFVFTHTHTPSRAGNGALIPVICSHLSFVPVPITWAQRHKTYHAVTSSSRGEGLCGGMGMYMQKVPTYSRKD